MASGGSDSLDRIRSTWCSRSHLVVFFQMMRMPLGDHVEYRTGWPTAGRPARAGRAAGRAGARRSPSRARQLAAEDLQQRRLAGAVAADDRDPFARLDLQRNVIEERQMAKSDRYVVQRQKCPRRHLTNVPRPRV